jgi:DNA-binding MarR family transcriptional regulator/GNAT superfamily N-acetyltransferase
MPDDPGGATTDPVTAVRRFNRFYTSAIGVLDKRYLGSPYTVAEGRTLYEIAARDGVTPKQVSEITGLDPGYLSRIVGRLERDGIVGRERSASDGRSVVLRLTPAGRRMFPDFNLRSVALVESLIEGLSADERRSLVLAIETAQSLLGRKAPGDGPVRLRTHATGDIGWVVQRHGVLYRREFGFDERFEALCAQIVGEFITNFSAARERSWIAERNGENVGCIFLQDAGKGVAKLRLLLVEPSARGLGLGRRLVDECVGAARELGYDEIQLWTQHVLVAARRIYAAVGFEIVETWPNRDFGGLGLTSEKWALELR